jgi:PAS domain S-box-containing protein
VVAKLARWAKQAGEKAFHLRRLNIGPRLTLCFVLIILAMFVGNAVLLWQFHRVRAQAERLSGVDQELIAVLQVHTNLMSFCERLDGLAQSANTAGLVREAEPLRHALLEDTQRSRNVLSRLPPEVQLDPTLLPTLEAIQSTLPEQLEAITALAKSRDWEAVRLHLANQVRPVESLTSALVQNVDREVSKERSQAVLKIGQAQQRILLIVPLTTVLTLLIAAFLGGAIRHSITQPLGRLVEGSKALARGEFEHHVAISGEDELAHLGRVFNNTAARLRDLYATLRQNERELRQLIEVIPQHVIVLEPDGSLVYVNQVAREYTGLTLEDSVAKDALAKIFHPDDLGTVLEERRRGISRGDAWEAEARVRGGDGGYRWFLIRANPLRDEQGRILRWYGTRTDIEDRKQAEDALRRSQAYLTEAQTLSHTGSFGWNVSSGEVSWSDETFRIFQCDPASFEPSVDSIVERIHPEDVYRVGQEFTRAAKDGTDLDFEHRLLMPDGSVKHLRVVGRASKDEGQGCLEFVGAVTDITERRQTEAALRRSEAYLTEAQRLTHTGSWAGTMREILYWSPETFRIFGLNPAKGKPSLEEFVERTHPDDRARFDQVVEGAVRGKRDFEIDWRLVLPDGTEKHVHTVGHPVVNEAGGAVELVGSIVDVTEQHEARAALEKALQEIQALKDQLYNENIALREEIDKASMFEEIVGVSPILQAVLAGVSKVAPTGSTVLIFGETGTGKELVARAIHKRSPRCSRAFVSVNCAAVPQDLIASELFGHEKGAFTGALQRRLGRFELAEGGTIFLDEVGDLPAETQVALLRVLQEREFERVGGTQTIRADVRVIAATNRDLNAAIASGTFRSDLFYRLNVFPLEIPPLRERREDIPLLVEYFIHRYASKAGKKIRSVHRKALDLLQSYPWPGNIRELQNVIERSVIVCKTETLSVDERWLSRTSGFTQPATQPLTRRPVTEEKQIIEAALAEARGRVSGPSGAAAKLGIPASTLESKIRSLNIDKHRFRTV